jgi:hypothetical protein
MMLLVDRCRRGALLLAITLVAVAPSAAVLRRLACPPPHALGGVRLSGHIVGFSVSCPSVQVCCAEAGRLGATSFTYNTNSSHTPLDPDCRLFGKLSAPARWDWNCSSCTSFGANLSTPATPMPMLSPARTTA